MRQEATQRKTRAASDEPQDLDRTAGGSVHHVEVDCSGAAPVVTPEYLRIQAEDSVKWHFRGVPQDMCPEIAFAPEHPRNGPFQNLVPGADPDLREPAGRVLTVLGQTADKIRRKYQYEARLVAKDGRCRGVDPVVDNEGKPPGNPA